MGRYTHKAENYVAGSLVHWIIAQLHCLCGTVSRNKFCLTLLLIMDNVNALLYYVSFLCSWSSLEPKELPATDAEKM
jgi:hypothetical protein